MFVRCPRHCKHGTFPSGSSVRKSTGTDESSPDKFPLSRKILNTALEPRWFIYAMSCICIAIIVVYLLFLPPLFSDRPRRCRRLHRCRVRLLRRRSYPTVELPGKQSHSLPEISPIFVVNF